jgi:endogenous inhibitor of DNA gyrase (YacG/DUF329 family)
MGYANPWDGYRVRRNLALAAYGSFLPVCVGVGMLLGRFAWVLWIAPALLVAWTAFLGYALVRLATWPCPWCGRPFLRGRVSVLWPFVRRCPDCGLPKWADPDEYNETPHENGHAGTTPSIGRTSPPAAADKLRRDRRSGP